MVHYLFALMMTWGAMTAPKPVAGELVVTVQNIKYNRGKIYMAVYNRKEGFLEVKNAVATNVTKVNGNKAVIRFKNLKPGYYAIATYHDKNNDGKMNTNMFGVPTEYYGFSRDARARFSAPSFEDARIHFKGGNMRTVINLK
ncbi:MAG TPA: hypothetical protein DCS93_09160 [Microscillaceae bacterium]|nr:hypothetical protein [Microscillaceae bacterium]